ncbi:MAG: EscU/YscU/HrcU family type III secretion system export apparatus switch protein [Chitinophagaceae bacterium]
MSEDKKHAPTDKRLKDAAEKGQVSISKDITHLLETFIVFETVYLLEAYWRHAAGAIITTSISYIDDSIPFKMAFSSILWDSFVFFAITSLITCGIAMLCGLLGTWVQIGIAFTPQVLIPNLDKFNPITNLKQMFSGRNLFNMLSNIAKALVILYIIYDTIHKILYAIVLVPTGTIPSMYEIVLEIFKSIERKTLMIFFPLAMLDFAIQKYFHRKQLRMDDKELEDEYKEMEGDPHLKGERKQFAHEIVFGDDNHKQAKNADSVVVNPTHYAVALSYNPEQYPLPIILARGIDEEAQSLIDMAKDNNIPVIRYIWLARTLYADGSVNRGIPRSTLKAVAFVYRLIRELKTAKIDLSKPQEVADEYTNTDGSTIMHQLLKSK